MTQTHFCGRCGGWRYMHRNGDDAKGRTIHGVSCLDCCHTGYGASMTEALSEWSNPNPDPEYP